MLGLDFGTTNSAIALAQAGRVDAARVASRSIGSRRTTFRSVLYFNPDENAVGRQPQRRRRAARHRGLPRRRRRRRRPLHPVAQVVPRQPPVRRHLRLRLEVHARGADRRHPRARCARAAVEQFGPLRGRVLIGRPVHFVVGGSGETDPERDAAALARLRRAAAQRRLRRRRVRVRAGRRGLPVRARPRPRRAGADRRLRRRHQRLLPHPPRPDARAASADRSRTILAVDGVPLAGNAFDARLVRAVVSPALGLGSLRRSERGQTLPIPSWIYSRLERWEDMSMLATPATLETLRQLRRQALEPERIDALIQLVQGDLGYLLYQEVERAKLALSLADAHRTSPSTCRRRRSRATSSGTSSRPGSPPTSARIAHLRRPPAGALRRRRRRRSTASSSPAARRWCRACARIFAERFGADRLRGGDELTTVARGLAMIAASSP